MHLPFLNQKQHYLPSWNRLEDFHRNKGIDHCYRFASNCIVRENRDNPLQYTAPRGIRQPNEFVYLGRMGLRN